MRKPADPRTREERYRVWHAFHVARRRLSYFKWCGVKCKQCPDDLYAFERILWTCRPTLLIETGTLRGGSSLLWSQLMLNYCSVPSVVSVDSDPVVPWPKGAPLELTKCVLRLTGNSVGQQTADAVKACAVEHARVMVTLDSDHDPDHVMREVELYAPLVTPGQYLVVQDTWKSYWLRDRDTCPRLAEFAKENGFVVDTDIQPPDICTYHPHGYLRKL